MNRPSAIRRRALHRLAARAHSFAEQRPFPDNIAAAESRTDVAWSATHGDDADRSNPGPWYITTEALHAQDAADMSEYGFGMEAAHAHRLAARAARPVKAN